MDATDHPDPVPGPVPAVSSMTATSSTSSDLPSPPPGAAAAPDAAGTVALARLEGVRPPDLWAPPPLRPGQLSPGWRLTFIAGWVGVLGGFGALWQACRIAGIAPWWLGPESQMRSVFVIALPFLAPLATIFVAMIGSRWSCVVGIGASVATAAVALGDLHFPGLAVVEALLGICGLLISVACLGGRMRAAPPDAPPSE